MRFVKISAILSTKTNLDCIRKCIFNATNSRITFFDKNGFSTMHLFFVLFSLQFHEAPKMVGLKIYQTVHKPTLCKNSL